MGEKKVNIFQIVVVGIFIALAVLGVILFATYRASTGSTGFSQPVELWGTLPSQVVYAMTSSLEKSGKLPVQVAYRQIDSRFYYDTLVEALAAGTGPDLFMLDHSATVSQWNKIILIPYEQFPQREFQNTFVDVAETYLAGNGVMAVPFALDPLMMYWNKDHFASAGIALAPQYWDELYDLVPRLAIIEDDGTVRRAAVALGEYNNIANAKALVSALMIQAGTPIVTWGNDGLVSVINQKFNYATMPAEAALRFYTEFSNPTKAAYTWNRAMRNSRDVFVGGELSIYFGFASEYDALRQANPNLRFDIAQLPQARSTASRATYANVTALALPRTSDNPVAALAVAKAFAQPESLNALSELTGLPPIRRDMVSQPQTDAYWSVAYNSAIISRTWLEPSPAFTDRVFSNMIDSITSGRASISDALGTAHQEISNGLE